MASSSQVISSAHEQVVQPMVQFLKVIRLQGVHRHSIGNGFRQNAHWFSLHDRSCRVHISMGQRFSIGLDRAILEEDDHAFNLGFSTEIVLEVETNLPQRLAQLIGEVAVHRKIRKIGLRGHVDDVSLQAARTSNTGMLYETGSAGERTHEKENEAEPSYRH